MIFLATFVSHVLPFIYIGFLALFFWAFLASLIPFGTFYADKVLFKE